MSSPEAQAFLRETVHFCDVGTAEIAYRKVGEGEPLLLMHGWPLSGFTYRKILPALAAHFTCYVVDSPGAGDTRWREENDFSFAGQAENFARLVERLGLDGFHVLAHDTGATIARRLALIQSERVRKMVLIGTEIPGHRPPWIPMFQLSAALPGATLVFGALLRSQTFLRSSMGFGGCFVDLSLLEGDFHAQFVEPLLRSPSRLSGQLRYLRGIDWKLVDSLAEGHRSIRGPVLLVWGDQDTVFPKERARAMVGQLPDCRGFEVIPGARLLVHEEKPEAVVRAALAFLGG